MKKLWLITALTLAVLGLSAGGTDKADINRMIFVSGIGIDRTGENYRYTLYTAVPTGSDTAVGDNNVEYKPVSVTADSMAHAMRRLEMNSSRDVSLEHLNCCALGASVTDDDLPALLDYLLRDPGVRRQCALLALDCTAEDFFSIDYSGSVASAAASLLEQQDDSPDRSSIMTIGRLDSAAENGSGYCLYILDTTQSESSASPSDANTASSIELRGLAIYSASGLSGRLNAQQTELARLFSNGQSSGVIMAVDNHGGRFLFEIRSASCNTDFNTGVPPLGRFTIEVDCVPVEYDGGSGEFPDDKQIAQSLYNQLSELLDMSRTYGSAFTGLETEARQSDRMWYEDHHVHWEDIYSTALLELDVKCHTSDGSE